MFEEQYHELQEREEILLNGIMKLEEREKFINKKERSLKERELLLEQNLQAIEASLETADVNFLQLPRSLYHF